jgi:hypothetical protein
MSTILLFFKDGVAAKSLEISSTHSPYGFNFLDRPFDYAHEDEEDEEDEYGENSCPSGCCDHDCECDDCLRCSNNGLMEPDGYSDDIAAAAA